MTEAYLIESLRANGLKVTPQRHLICKLIAAADGQHPTAEMLYEEAARVMPTLSLKTVYATVSELAQIGVVRLARFGTENLRVDVATEPHAHAVCEGCDKLFDVPLSAESMHTLWQAAPQGRFHIEDLEVVYRGRCAECAARQGAGESPLEKGGERDGTQ